MSEARLAIAEVVENWAIWRDAGDWERLRTAWHGDGWMSATWFQGPAAQFIEASRAGFAKGVNVLHFLGGCSVEVKGDRAIARGAGPSCAASRSTRGTASIRSIPPCG